MCLARQSPPHPRLHTYMDCVASQPGRLMCGSAGRHLAGDLDRIPADRFTSVKPEVSGIGRRLMATALIALFRPALFSGDLNDSCNEGQNATCDFTARATVTMRSPPHSPAGFRLRTATGFH
jgi:hypothetical protein